MMPVLSEHMMSVIKQQPVVFVATSDSRGEPYVSPRGALHILDRDKLVFADLFSNKTRANLRHNARLAVAVVDLKRYEGYQFRGWAEVVDSGPVYEEMVALLARSSGVPPPMELWFERVARELTAALRRAGQPAARPHAAVILHIEEIWNLAPGHQDEVWR